MYNFWKIRGSNIIRHFYVSLVFSVTDQSTWSFRLPYHLIIYSLNVDTFHRTVLPSTMILLYIIPLTEPVVFVLTTPLTTPSKYNVYFPSNLYKIRVSFRTLL